MISEVRAGKREGSVISTISLDLTSRSKQETWADLQRELEDIGISTSMINDNKQFIVAWFQEAIKRGGLEEQTSHDDFGETDTSYDDIGDDTKCGDLEVDIFHGDMGDDTRFPHDHRSEETIDQTQISADHGTPSNSSSLGNFLSQRPSPAQRVAPGRIAVSGIGQSPRPPEHIKRSVQPASRQKKAERSGISSLLSKLRSKDILLFEAIDSGNSDEVA